MGHYSVCYYSGMRSFSIDAYVVDTLMRDLIEHDGRPSSFVVYLYLWGRTIGQSQRSVHQSHQQLADATAPQPPAPNTPSIAPGWTAERGQDPWSQVPARTPEFPLDDQE
jgi:hypothetical protein